MPARNPRSLLIIPPRGGRIRFVRVRVVVIGLLTLFFMAGFAGLFISFSGLSLDVEEQNEKKNLSDQNQKLLQRIHGMRKSLHVLDTRVEKLKVWQKDVEAVAGLSVPPDSSPAGPEGVLDVRQIDKLLEYVSNSEALYSRLVEQASGKSALFAWVPVLEPVSGEYVITAGFGEMIDPFTGTKRFHYGLDYAAKRETPVVATADGVVVAVENHRRWGRRVRLRHAHGFSTVYAHLGTVHVQQGRRVKRGEIIATVGISGLTTGPHLHYETWRGGKPVDPLQYVFPKGDVALGEGKLPRS